MPHPEESDPFLGPDQPSPTWRLGSSLVMGLTGFLCRSFLLGASHLEVEGLDGFLKLLDERRDVEGRERGLITVSNHTMVMDDPIMWGAIPFKYHWNPDHLRWSLASHDLVFKHKAIGQFFSLGQTLPTHRIAHSAYGGLFQPTVTQTIRLLSRQPFTDPYSTPQSSSTSQSISITDPFTNPAAPPITYTTTGIDSFPAPSAYLSRKHAWVHIFPEGRIHQHPERSMRYFKWGVARLILESEPAPLLVPVWIEGFDQIMHESRQFPRFIPRPGKDVKIIFADGLETEQGIFGELRERWRRLVERDRRKRENDGSVGGEVEEVKELGILTEELKYGEEAVNLREETTMKVREEILKLRNRRGWPEEDPKAKLVDTWREEGRPGKREGRMNDGSWIKDA